MTTIINASNGSTSGLITTADASGVLQLQTNNGTPAITLNTTQALGVGTSPAYGTSGQVLTSAGSAASPTWTTPSSGAMTLISTQTASNSSSLHWTGLSGYNSYVLIFNNMTYSNWCFLNIQIGYGATPTYYTSNYLWAITATLGSTTTITYSKNDTQGYIFSSRSGLQSNWIVGGQCILTGMTTTSQVNISANLTGSDTGFGYNTQSFASTSYAVSAQTTAIKIYFDSGVITSGTASLYGISS